MNVHEVVSRCRNLGVILAPGPGGTLRAAPPGRLPEGLREELRKCKSEVLALLKQPQPSFREQYRQAAEAVQEECFRIDPVWLIDHHPSLWQELVMLDDELSRLEQQRTPEPACFHTLERLCAVVRQARALYERRKQRTEPVRQ